MRILAGPMDHIDNSDISLNADKVKLSSTLQDILVHYAVAIGHRQCCTMCTCAAYGFKKYLAGP